MDGGLPREELERLMFFETAREQAEKDWSHNPRDTQVSCFDSPERLSGAPGGLRRCAPPWRNAAWGEQGGLCRLRRPRGTRAIGLHAAAEPRHNTAPPGKPAVMSLQAGGSLHLWLHQAPARLASPLGKQPSGLNPRHRPPAAVWRLVVLGPGRGVHRSTAASEAQPSRHSRLVPLPCSHPFSMPHRR